MGIFEGTVISNIMEISIRTYRTFLCFFPDQCMMRGQTESGLGDAENITTALASKGGHIQTKALT